MVTLAGQVIVGSIRSLTVTLAEHVAVLPLLSVTINVTGLGELATLSHE